MTTSLHSDNVRYMEAVAFLDSTINRGVKLGLASTRELLGALGDPQVGLPLIHVAGTNGKGSVCALLEGALLGAGLRVGMSSSPHLICVRERIRLQGVPISEDEFADHIETVRTGAGHLFDSVREVCPTYFEVLTAVTFLAFRRHGIQAGVVEVGLGGRLDSTNVITPAVSVITSIDLDHTRILGDDLATIAGEKAGIIKPGMPVVVGETKAEAVAKLLSVAAERGCDVALMGREFEPVGAEISTTTTGWSQANTIRSGDETVGVISPLIGPHQLSNAAVAHEALICALRGGWMFDLAAAREGMQRTRWAARLQRLADGLIVDSAHNPAGMAVSVTAIKQAMPGVQFDVLCGFLGDKQWQESLGVLMPIVKSLRVAPIDSPRSEVPSIIRSYVRETWPEIPVIACRSAESGLRGVQRSANPLVIGSIYFAGEVLAQYYPDGVVI